MAKGHAKMIFFACPAAAVPGSLTARQRDRARAANVIDVPYDRRAIVEAIRRAMTPEFRRELEGFDSPYLSDGRVSERIVEILKTIPIDERLLRKQIAY